MSDRVFVKMKTQFGFIDPGAIMGVVVALIILAVGVFAFFVTIQSIPLPAAGISYDAASNASNTSRFNMMNSINNSSSVGNQVFNIIGIVMIIGAIMSIVGLVYNYVR